MDKEDIMSLIKTLIFYSTFPHGILSVLYRMEESRIMILPYLHDLEIERKW